MPVLLQTGTLLLLRLSIRSCISKVTVCFLSVLSSSGCHKLLFPMVTARWLWKILSDQTLNGKFGSECVSQPFFLFQWVQQELIQCCRKAARIHLGRRYILNSRRRAFGNSGGGFWGHWRRPEAQFHLAFRGFLMPNFSCLCTSYPFSAQDRGGTCFTLKEVLVCAAAMLGPCVSCVSCSCSVVFGWICNSPPAKWAAGCTGHWSAQLTSLLLVWSQASPGVQMHSSAMKHLHCSLHTFRHNIYNCTWPWSIALFQINDHTIFLLGFCNFLFCSQNCSSAQTPGKGVL